MPATSNKQRLLSDLLSAVPNHKEVLESETGKPVLEEFIYGLCREGTNQEKADRAYRNLCEQFFDWNEIRVSSIREIADALGDVPHAEAKAQRIIQFLQEVFETTFSFNLDPLNKKGLKHAAKQLGRYQTANEYSVAWVVQRCLGGHALPLDAPSVRVLCRLGLVEEHTDTETARASLEHQIPKAKGKLFTEAVSEIAISVCKEIEPQCTQCPLHSHCPSGANLNGKVPQHAKAR